MKHIAAAVAMLAGTIPSFASAETPGASERTPVPETVSKMCKAIKVPKKPALRVLAVYVSRTAKPSDGIFICAKAPPGVRHDQGIVFTLFSRLGYALTAGNVENLCRPGSNSGAECTKTRFVAPATQRELCRKSVTGDPNSASSYECIPVTTPGKPILLDEFRPLKARTYWTYKKAGTNNPIPALREVSVVMY